MSAEPDLVFDPPRELTPEERVILDFVIDANPEHRDALRAFFLEAKVTDVCRCGCGSPALMVDPSTTIDLQSVPEKLPGEAAAKVQGVALTVMLFVGNDPPGGYLELVWSLPNEDRPGRLPHADELEIAVWEPISGSPRSYRLTNFDTG